MLQNGILACSFMVMLEPVILKGTVFRLRYIGAAGDDWEHKDRIRSDHDDDRI